MERVWPEVQDLGALRERAQALGVEGAEAMDKDELTRAVGAAQRQTEQITDSSLPS